MGRHVAGREPSSCCPLTRRTPQTGPAAAAVISCAPPHHVCSGKVGLCPWFSALRQRRLLPVSNRQTLSKHSLPPSSLLGSVTSGLRPTGLPPSPTEAGSLLALLLSFPGGPDLCCQPQKRKGGRKRKPVPEAGGAGGGQVPAPSRGCPASRPWES